MLGDVLLIYQIKERSSANVGDAEAETRWFNKEVLRDATRQVRSTLSYLQAYSEIRVTNERGKDFNLAARSFADIIKIVIYLPSANLPAHCCRVHHHVSQTTGAFIHIVDARDYLEILRTLRVPQEVVRYFNYRQSALVRFGDICAELPETAIAGHFIGGNPDVPPKAQSAGHLYRLVQDANEWDIAPLLRGLHDHVAVPDKSDDYYDVLIEFAKLPRSAWRTVKERIRLCIEKAQKDEFAKPYRTVYPDTGCGFVFIPVESALVKREDWSTIRTRALTQLTEAHKYDQRLSKSIGFLVAKNGTYFDIFWCLVAHEWVAHPEFQRLLDTNFPFRQIKPTKVHGYHLTGD